MRDFGITVIPCSPYGDAEIELARSGKQAKPKINARIIFAVLSLVWLTIFFIATVFAAENLHATEQEISVDGRKFPIDAFNQWNSLARAQAVEFLNAVIDTLAF
jgi:hypothetical protein